MSPSHIKDEEVSVDRRRLSLGAVMREERDDVCAARKVVDLYLQNEPYQRALGCLIRRLDIFTHVRHHAHCPAISVVGGERNRGLGVPRRDSDIVNWRPNCLSLSRKST